MDDRALSKPLVIVPLLLSIILNVAGLASVAEGAVTWWGFFKEITNLYQAAIRQPIIALVELFYPKEWPHIPVWVYDVTIVWCTFGISTRLMTAFGADDIGKVMNAMSGVRYVQSRTDAAIGFLLGPFAFIGIVALLFMVRRRRFESWDRFTDPHLFAEELKRKNIGLEGFNYDEERKELEFAFYRRLRSETFIVVRLLSWYFVIFGLFLLMLFWNYQITRVKHVGWVECSETHPTPSADNPSCADIRSAIFQPRT